MAHPKRRQSHTRQAKRRTHDKAKMPALALSITNSWSLFKLNPSSQWCHPTISSSVGPFSSHLQSFPSSGSFPMSQLFASGDQKIGVSASASAYFSPSINGNHVTCLASLIRSDRPEPTLLWAPDSGITQLPKDLCHIHFVFISYLHSVGWLCAFAPILCWKSVYNVKINTSF